VNLARHLNGTQTSSKSGRSENPFNDFGRTSSIRWLTILSLSTVAVESGSDPSRHTSRAETLGRKIRAAVVCGVFGWLIASNTQAKAECPGGHFAIVEQDGVAVAAVNYNWF
jgi:hypothetical protein